MHTGSVLSLVGAKIEPYGFTQHPY